MDFLTIRQAARRGPISEHHLRELVKEGNCPGICSGNRFLVNYDMLLDRLEKMSRKAVRTE